MLKRPEEAVEQYLEVTRKRSRMLVLAAVLGGVVASAILIYFYLKIKDKMFIFAATIILAFLPIDIAILNWAINTAAQKRASLIECTVSKLRERGLDPGVAWIGGIPVVVAKNNKVIMFILKNINEIESILIKASGPPEPLENGLTRKIQLGTLGVPVKVRASTLMEQAKKRITNLTGCSIIKREGRWSLTIPDWSGPARLRDAETLFVNLSCGREIERCLAIETLLNVLEEGTASMN